MFQEQRISTNVPYDRGHRNYSEDQDQKWNNKSSTSSHTRKKMGSCWKEGHWETDIHGVTWTSDNMLKE
jgi:hypothetical protein